MNYINTVMGKFISRPNRFIAIVEINGDVEICHVKNTGRNTELLIEGAVVILQEFVEAFALKNRKTKFDLIAVYKNNNILINIDSQIPNGVFREWAEKNSYFGANAIIKAEKTYKNSRFDFYVQNGERRVFIEVKGVTLIVDRVGMFPDAPTIRGLKHINELIDAVENGYEALVVFVVQCKGIDYFTPHRVMQKEFGDALDQAAKVGVKMLCLDCDVLENSIVASEIKEIKL
ncbi:MAG: DNA/RNA nuclease SfsA [Eubacteriales bacterium]